MSPTPFLHLPQYRHFGVRLNTFLAWPPMFCPIVPLPYAKLCSKRSWQELVGSQVSDRLHTAHDFSKLLRPDFHFSFIYIHSFFLVSGPATLWHLSYIVHIVWKKPTDWSYVPIANPCFIFWPWNCPYWRALETLLLLFACLLAP